MERSVLVVEESPQRVRLVQFDHRHREIARILGPKGLSVPKGAEARLLEGLTAVATLAPGPLGHRQCRRRRCRGRRGRPRRPQAAPAPDPPGGWPDPGPPRPPLGSAGPHLRPGQGHASLFTDQAGRVIHCTRDLDAERAAARSVPTHCPILDGNDGWTWELDDTELALGALEQLHALGDAVVLDWPQGKRITLTGPLDLGGLGVAIRTRGDWLEVSGEVRLSDGRVLAMRELLDLAAASRGRFVQLGDKDFLVLSEALRRRLDGLRGLTDGGRFHPLAAPAIAEIIDGMDVAAAPAWEALLERIGEPARPGAANAIDPPGGAARLPGRGLPLARPARPLGGRGLPRRRHGSGQDGPGPGPDPVAGTPGPDSGPGAHVGLRQLGGRGAALCAYPEAPALRPRRPRRSPQGGRPLRFDRLQLWALTEREPNAWPRSSWETVFADEAQAFKNALTKRSQAMMRLHGGFRLITTGTPIENRLGELWNLFRFINPGLLGSLESFNRRFAIPIEQVRTMAPASGCGNSCAPSYCGASRARS